MTYYITALTNNRAQLIAKEAQTTCKDTADTIAAAWVSAGYKISRREWG